MRAGSLPVDELREQLRQRAAAAAGRAVVTTAATTFAAAFTAAVAATVAAAAATGVGATGRERSQQPPAHDKACGSQQGEGHQAPA